MKLRIIMAALCATALAAPVIATATSTQFEDVPLGHKHTEAIRWASDPTEFGDGPALFRGFHDGSFRPDRDLTENQLITVTKRLFNSQDAWTRAETAALLYHGFQALYGEDSPSAVSSTTSTATIPNAPTMIEYRGTEYIEPSSFYLLLHSSNPLDVKIQASYKCSPTLYKRLSAGITKILIPCANVVGGTNAVFFQVTGAQDGTRYFTGAVRFPRKPTATTTTTTAAATTTTTAPPIATTTTAAATTSTTLYPVVIEPMRSSEGWFHILPPPDIKHQFRISDVWWR